MTLNIQNNPDKALKWTLKAIEALDSSDEVNRKKGVSRIKKIGIELISHHHFNAVSTILDTLTQPPLSQAAISIILTLSAVLIQKKQSVTKHS